MLNVLVTLLLSFRFVCEDRGWVGKAWLSVLSLCWPHKTKGVMSSACLIAYRIYIFSNLDHLSILDFMQCLMLPFWFFLSIGKEDLQIPINQDRIKYFHTFDNNLIIMLLHVLTFLTLPPWWAGCYTCPVLRPYQFGPVRIPECNHKVTGYGHEAVDGCEAVN